MRTHFTKDSSSALDEEKPTDLHYAIPAAAAGVLVMDAGAVGVEVAMFIELARR